WRANEAAAEPIAGNADDGVVAAVQRDQLADDVVAVEPPAPERIADDHDRRRGVAIVSLGQRAAVGDWHAEEREIAAGRDLADDLIGPVVSLEHEWHQRDA